MRKYVAVLCVMLMLVAGLAVIAGCGEETVIENGDVEPPPEPGKDIGEQYEEEGEKTGEEYEEKYR